MANDEAFLKMVADYMEAGLLENIVDMFRHDRTLFNNLGYFIQDERSRVRIGFVAVVETLRPDFESEAVAAIPHIAKALENPDPVIRGDAVYMLEVIGHGDAIPHLGKLAEDPHHAVRESAMEAIEAVRVKHL